MVGQRRVARGPGIALAAIVGLWTTGAAVATDGQSAESALSAALYTTAQAERGRGEYTTWCAHCHRSDLLGDERAEVPSLAEDSFFLRWEGRSLSALYEMISKDMPGDKPGALDARACADIVAYILQVNGYPAGARELRAGAAALKDAVIERP